jgi:hypothetical protein
MSKQPPEKHIVKGKPITKYKGSWASRANEPISNSIYKHSTHPMMTTANDLMRKQGYKIPESTIDKLISGEISLEDAIEEKNNVIGSVLRGHIPGPSQLAALRNRETSSSGEWHEPNEKSWKPASLIRPGSGDPGSKPSNTVGDTRKRLSYRVKLATSWKGRRMPVNPGNVSEAKMCGTREDELDIKESRLDKGHKGAIDWLVARRHVLDDPEEVADDIEKRFKRAKQPKTGKPFTQSYINSAREYAKKSHAKNLDLYKSVQTGKFK